MSKSKTSSDAKAESKGLLMILSAPSGCGKTTLVDRLLKRHPDWVRSISSTTRPPRPDEKDGSDYFFVTPARFKEMEGKGEFLESARIFNHDYGTPKAELMRQVEEGKKIILAIDVQGMKQIQKGIDKKIPLLTVFVLPPSIKVLRERLEGRKTEPPDEIQRRIELAQEEIKAASFYDYTVVNQQLEPTVLEIEELVSQFQNKRRKQTHVLRPS
ncbi:MAG TPA: guanylate kinase [bacterium]|nr:guanylate kinase [bacterium]